MNQTISVVTICYNNLPELEQTCASVDKQSLPPFEHLIIDGSTDAKIVEWLQTTPQPTYRRWIHERDNGISDAFNKGIQNAKGTIIHLLNSGDRYEGSHAIESVMLAFEKDPELMWTHCRYIQHRGDMDVISGQRFEKHKLWKGMRTVAHPGMFIKKEVYDRVGLYNTDYKIAMDYDLLVRIRNEKFFFISRPLVYFAPGGASDQQFSRGLKEVRASYQQNIGSSLKQTLWQTRQRLLHAFMKTRVGKAWFQRKNQKSKVEIQKAM